MKIVTLLHNIFTSTYTAMYDSFKFLYTYIREMLWPRFAAYFYHESSDIRPESNPPTMYDVPTKHDYLFRILILKLCIGDLESAKLTKAEMGNLSKSELDKLLLISITSKSDLANIKLIANWGANLRKIRESEGSYLNTCINQRALDKCLYLMEKQVPIIKNIMHSMSTLLELAEIGGQLDKTLMLLALNKAFLGLDDQEFTKLNDTYKTTFEKFSIMTRHDSIISKSKELALSKSSESDRKLGLYLLRSALRMDEYKEELADLHKYLQQAKTDIDTLAKIRSTNKENRRFVNLMSNWNLDIGKARNLQQAIAIESKARRKIPDYYFVAEKHNDREEMLIEAGLHWTDRILPMRTSAPSINR